MSWYDSPGDPNDGYELPPVCKGCGEEIMFVEVEVSSGVIKTLPVDPDILSTKLLDDGEQYVSQDNELLYNLGGTDKGYRIHKCGLY